MESATRVSAWRSPSNIAIIKYWGKHGDQLPDNPSVSLTLSSACTETHVSLEPEPAGMEFLFHNKQEPAFARRIEKYLLRVAPDLLKSHIRVTSRNTFPHSSGIASSASAMSALALCITELQSHADVGSAEFFRSAAETARLGSGSASRSLYGPVCLWGHTELITGSSDTYAMPLADVHPVFATMQDSILIVDDTAKAVSSSAGHALMEHHLFRTARLAQAKKHLHELLPAMRNGDLEIFGTVAEAEALTLHALMMTSTPSYLLMEPRTLEILQRVRTFRDEAGMPVYFTLDAGPNVHILYPAAGKDEVRDWISQELMSFCKEGQVIHDHVGSGPARL